MQVFPIVLQQNGGRRDRIAVAELVLNRGVPLRHRLGDLQLQLAISETRGLCATLERALLEKLLAREEVLDARLADGPLAITVAAADESERGRVRQRARRRDLRLDLLLGEVSLADVSVSGHGPGRSPLFCLSRHLATPFSVFFLRIVYCFRIVF
jgi:hypothetical protein